MRRAALLVSALTALSTLLGLVRDIVIAAVFGAGAQLDAWFVAQGVMNLALGLISGAMARSLTPTLARQSAGCTGRDPGEAGADGESATPRGGAPPPHRHPTLDVAVTVTLLVLGLASLVLAVAAGPVVGVLAPGFDPEQRALAEHLTRIVLLATLLVSGTNLLAGASHAHGRFGWASIQGVPFNVVMIIAAGVFGPRYGVAALAAGFVVGSGARLAFQFVPLRALRLHIRPSLDVRDPGFREIGRMLPPLLLGSAITNVNQLVDRAVASTVGDGAITALSYGWRVVNLPEMLLVAALIVPLYPAIGAAAGDAVELRRLLARATTTVLAVLAPMTAVLLVASDPVVATLFGYGSFAADSVAAAAQALRWYAPGLLALGLGTVLLRASHAVGDARTPTLVALLAMVANVVGSVTLGPVLGIRGIALATTISLVLAAAVNGVALVRKHTAFDARGFAAVCARVLPAAVVAGGAGLAARVVLESAMAGPPPVLVAALVGVVVLGVYLAVLAAIRAPEMGLLREALPGRRRRNPDPPR